MQIDDTSAPGLTDVIRSTISSWGITAFTQIQDLALKAGVAEGRSQIVCAPTSSGKTLVGEIAILAALSRGQRCLYLVSHKALADQKYLDFTDKFGGVAAGGGVTVGLSTGDRDEGEASPQLLIATYEKVLALLLSAQIDISQSVVIADELQILGEDGRGPNIETLCAIFRQQGILQLVALTATIGNAPELAAWLSCELVLSHARDVDLHQEIWNGTTGYRLQFGQEEGEACHVGETLPQDTLHVVRRLIAMGRAPVLVFTESRIEAADLAARYSQITVRTADGIALAEQLALYSEPTESSEQLHESVQRRVSFHTADLTAQQRQVIEKGFSDNQFDVCFATSTLAAGVNFPFRSVVFPKLTYQWGEREGTMIVRSDYRNMSGRAGRLGHHPDGYAILLPRNSRELAHANMVILPDNDHIKSQLVRLSMRRTVLALVSFNVVSNRGSLTDFFQHSFYWHQIRERNPKKLDDVIASAIMATDWLVEQRLLEEDYGIILATPVGKAVAQSGLLPSTAVSFIAMMTANSTALEADFESYITGLIHWVCNCPEFASERPSRFLPWPAGRRPVDSAGFLRTHTLLGPLDRTSTRINQCAHAVTLFAQGAVERNIRFQTSIPSGQLHRLATDVAWIFDGLRKIASVPELGHPQTLTNKMTMLAQQIQWGAPTDALDILRVAQREGVPGFGRQRAVALLQQGILTFDQLLGATKDKLSAALGNERRITSLLKAVATSLGSRAVKFQKLHQEVAEKIGLEDAVKACSKALGVEYDAAVKVLLETEPSWKTRLLDDGIQQNVPDLMLTLGQVSVLIECKTTTKNPPLVKKEEAFAVLQKAVGFDPSMPRVTLGKPGFDDHSKKKVQSATDVTLVEHEVFIEGILRVATQSVTPEEFVAWLSAPGLTELDRLGGAPSYEILRNSTKL